MGKVEEKVDQVLREIKTGYVSKAEFQPIKEKVEFIQNGLDWGVRIVLGAVMLAVLGLVITNI